MDIIHNVPIPELERLSATTRFLDLEIIKEIELVDLVRLAAEICPTPTALVTLLDDQTMYVKFETEFDQDKTDRRDACCSSVSEKLWIIRFSVCNYAVTVMGKFSLWYWL